MSSDDTRLDSVTAAPLPEALHARLLAAMQNASAEERALRSTEERLRRLSPAAMPLSMMGRLGMNMYVAAAGQENRRTGYGWLHHSAAAALVCCAVAGFALYGNATAGPEPQGLVTRGVLDSHENDTVIWNGDATPMRSYEVIYEDFFVMEDGDTTVTVRVPNTTRITVPAEIL